MGRGERGTRRTPPVSVALPQQDRVIFEEEARRRGLGLSTTIRTLASERTHELRAERQRERAMRWQTQRLRGLIERIEREGIREVSQSDIDAVFAAVEAQERRASAASA